jgi:hypothetical protein
MRESPKTEKMHLGDAYEEWLKHQTTRRKKARHPRKPVKDLYEAWVEKRVEKRLGVAGQSKQATS